MNLLCSYFFPKSIQAEEGTKAKPSLKKDNPINSKSFIPEFPLQGIIPPVAPKNLRAWPNLQTLFTIATLVNNVAFQFFPHPALLATNVIIRCASIAFALYSRNEAKIASDAISIAAVLTLTNGCMIATAADLIFEGINFYRREISRKILKSRIYCFISYFSNKETKKKTQKPLPYPYTLKFEDPKVPANACRLLNIDEKQKEDQDLIEKQYKKIHEMHFSRQKDINSEILAYQFQLMIDHLDEAYRTLKKT